MTRPPMSAKELKDRLRAGCVQVFVPVTRALPGRARETVWLHTTQREARYLRTELKGQIDVAPPHWTLDQVLASRCGGGRILRLVPRNLD